MPVSGKGGKYQTIITQRYIHFNVDHLISLQVKVANTKCCKVTADLHASSYYFVGPKSMHLLNRNQCICLSTWKKSFETIIILSNTILLLSYNRFNHVIKLFLACTVSQKLLHSLLLFQKESPNNTLSDTSSASTATVGTGNSPLALLEVRVSRSLKVLDSRKRAFAVWASGSLGGFGDFLCLVHSTGGLDGTDASRPGVVWVASSAGNSVINHFDDLYKRIETVWNKQRVKKWLAFDVLKLWEMCSNARVVWKHARSYWRNPSRCCTTIRQTNCGNTEPVALLSCAA